MEKSVFDFFREGLLGCLCVTVFVLVGAQGGYSADTSDLDRLREIYFKQVGDITLPVKKKYGRSLVALQKQLVEENALEEALEVKAEIERLKSSIASGVPEAVSPATPAPAPLGGAAKSLMEGKEVPESESKDRFRWTGDMRKDKYQGEVVYRLDAESSSDVQMRTLLDDLQDEYPKGFTWRFLYRSEDYKGIGFRIGCNFPGIQILRTVGTAVRPNGNWIERTQPFPDTKGEDEAEFLIQLFKGEGSVMIKDVEIIPLP